MLTVDQSLKPISVPVRVGQAVDVVGQAGRPKTITGFQTHSTPVLLAAGERAELATEKYVVPLIPLLHYPTRNKTLFYILESKKTLLLFGSQVHSVVAHIRRFRHIEGKSRLQRGVNPKLQAFEERERAFEYFHYGCQKFFSLFPSVPRKWFTISPFKRKNSFIAICRNFLCTTLISHSKSWISFQIQFS